MAKFIGILLAAVLTENYILSKFLGICPFLGVSKKIKTAVGMSFAVIFVMTIATAVTYPIYVHVLVKNDLAYLQTIVFILVIAALVQLVEIVMKKLFPPLHKALGIYLPLITTNCAVLGSALLNIQNGYNFIYSVLFGFASGVGFTMAILIFAGVRTRMMFSEPPRSFRGIPIALITAGLISMAFMGFSGIKIC